VFKDALGADGAADLARRLPEAKAEDAIG